MNTHPLPEDLHAAHARVTEGEAEPGDDMLVAAALRDDPALLEETRRQLLIDALLRQEAEPASSEAFVAGVASRLFPQSEADEAFVRRVGQALPRRENARRAWRSPLVWAAAVVLLAGVAAWQWLGSTAPSPVTAQVVRVVGLDELASRTLMVGGVVTDGTVDLRQGMVEMRSQRGVQVVVEAPARYRWLAEERLMVSEGRASAEVPPGAEGFTIVTPDTEVEDLGTRFGVSVDRQGRSEVHVFEGEVVARLRDGAASSGDKPARSVRQGEAIATGSPVKKEQFASRSSAFVQPEEFSLVNQSLAAQRSRFDHWTEQLLSDPSLILYYDPVAGPRGALAAGILEQETMPQEGLILGREAVEFSAPEHRLILPLKESRQLPQATIMTWVRVDDVQGRYQTICFADGAMPFSRVEPEYLGRFQWSFTKQTRLRFAVVGSASSRATEKGAVMALSAPNRRLGSSRWQHLAITYNAKARRLTFFVDGKRFTPVAFQTAPPLSLPTRLHLGSAPTTDEVRDLSGRMDSFTILARVLSHEEIRSAHAAGTPYQ